MTSMRSSGLKVSNSRIHWYPRVKMLNVKMTIVLWYYRQTMNTDKCLQRTALMMQAMTIE